MDIDENTSRLTEALRALVASGFTLESASRNPGYALLHMYRYDEFGSKHSYCFAIADEVLSEGQLQAASIAADHHNAHLVYVGVPESTSSDIGWSRFITLLGGPVPGVSPLDEQFQENLIALGYNKLPEELDGNPDDLYEMYVWSGLSFLLGGRAIKYGQERLFESVPDGMLFKHSNFVAMYDAKAYSDGYIVSADSIRQFSAYVEDFSNRYQAYLQRINAFLVISSAFAHRPETLGRRSRELFARCGVPISFVTSEDLSRALAIILDNPRTRQSIQWGQVFANPIFSQEYVEDEVQRILRDRVILT